MPSLAMQVDTVTQIQRLTVFSKRITSVHSSNNPYASYSKNKTSAAQTEDFSGGISVLYFFCGWSHLVRRDTWKIGTGNEPLCSLCTRDVIHAGNISLVVEKLRRDSQELGPLTPRSGYEFLVPTVVLKTKRRNRSILSLFSRSM